MMTFKFSRVDEMVTSHVGTFYASIVYSFEDHRNPFIVHSEKIWLIQPNFRWHKSNLSMVSKRLVDSS